MDTSNVTNVTKTGSVTPSVASVTGSPSGVQSSAVVGNSLPDVGQTRVRAEASLAANPVSSLNSEELDNLVEQVNVTLQGRFSDLKFTVADGTNISVVRIEDAETGELIRQVPSEAMVAIARALEESQRGMVLEEKA